ncbi:MAG TPA: HEAT repeat domain-containing protein [Gemmatimonadaceae bacterium]|jgi:HEAT repeat protein/cyclophilin family peptidyl-prolyl cis-trans isomerase
MKRFALGFALSVASVAGAQGHPSLRPADVDDIARLVMLEDYRDFNAADLARILASTHPEVRRRAALSIGRIADKRGYALLRAKPLDADTAVAATEVFAAGQLKDSTTVSWFDSLLTAPKLAPTVRAEAATALGKVKTAAAREALARFLASATEGKLTDQAINEALYSIGRCTARGDLAPILKWTSSKNDEIRWHATWALFRPRDPSAVPALMKLATDKSADVRMWALRGLVKSQADSAGKTAETEALVLAAMHDPDRRVRTEAVRSIGFFTDSAAVSALNAAKADGDWWISSSADEGLARLNPPPAAPGRGGRGGGGRGARPVPPPPTRPLSDYKALVERWVVPDYNGAPRPTATWDTPRGTITIELYAGDAPLGVEEFVRIVEAGSIVGTKFTRVVPNFVDQEQTIPGAKRLRDEVTRRGLTRANLAWASGGLDTGTPGYTLANAIQPHNEGDFTTLGRVIKGMDVVDQIQLNDAITAAKMATVR